MFQLIVKSMLKGLVTLWIILPAIFFVFLIIFQHDHIVPEYCNEKELEEYCTIGDQFKYYGEFVARYIQIAVYAPYFFIIWMPYVYERFPLETVLVWILFIATSGTYFICNYKLKDEWN